MAAFNDSFFTSQLAQPSGTVQKDDGGFNESFFTEQIGTPEGGAAPVNEEFFTQQEAPENETQLRPAPEENRFDALTRKILDVFRDPESEKAKAAYAVDAAEQYGIRPHEALGYLEEVKDQTGVYRDSKAHPLVQLAETVVSAAKLPAQFVASKGAGLVTLAGESAFSTKSPEEIREAIGFMEHSTAELFPTAKTPAAKLAEEALETLFTPIKIATEYYDKELLKDYPRTGYVVGLGVELLALGAGHKVFTKVLSGEKLTRKDYKELKEGVSIEDFAKLKEPLKAAEAEVKAAVETPVKKYAYKTVSEIKGRRKTVRELKEEGRDPIVEPIETGDFVETPVRELKTVEEIIPERSQREHPGLKEKAEKVLKEKEVPIEKSMSPQAKDMARQMREHRIKKMAETDPLKAEAQRKAFERKEPEPKELKEEVLKDEIFEEYKDDRYNEFDMSEGREIDYGTPEAYEGRSNFGSEVFDSFFDTLGSEKGAIEIGNMFNAVRRKREKRPEHDKITSIKNLSVRELNMLKDIEKQAKELKLPVEEVLSQQGVSPEGIRGIKDLIKETKTPRQATKDWFETSELKETRPEDIFTLLEGKKMVNDKLTRKERRQVARGLKSKEEILAGRKIKISEEMGEWIQNMPDLRAPDVVKLFTTAPKSLKKLGGPAKKIQQHVYDMERSVLVERTQLKKRIKALERQYGKSKGRLEANKRAISLSKYGTDALIKQGEGMLTSKYPEYDALIKELEPLYKDLYQRGNEIRELTGQRKMKEMDHYVPFFTREAWLDNVSKIFSKDPETGDFRSTTGKVNFIQDSLSAVKLRHTPKVAKEMNLHHLKRNKLIPGTKLELDPLKLALRYGSELIEYIHMAPIASYLKELSTAKLKDPVTGKYFSMRTHKPGAAKFFSEWSNNLVGVPNWIVPPVVDRAAKRISNNLTSATLLYNARTLMVQGTALVPTAVEYGYIPTFKGITDVMLRSKKQPIELSRKLPTAEMDAFLNDYIAGLSGNLVTKSLAKIKHGGKELLGFADYFAREATWRTAYSRAIKAGRMTKEQAVRAADDAVVRTQASGAKSDLSPIQMNAIGRAATLWQTYTINHINWIAKDVLGIKNPELNKVETTKRVMRYTFGMASIYALFENGMGVESPMPSPINKVIDGLNEGDSGAAIALSAMLESLEFFPFGANFRYASHPLGPVVEHLGELTKIVSGSDVMYKDLIPKAIDGDERAMLILADFLATSSGVPGTGQAAKYMRGRNSGKDPLEAIIGTRKQKKRGSFDIKF